MNPVTHPLSGLMYVSNKGEPNDYELTAELYGRQYAHELEKFSYGLSPPPLEVMSLLSLPPNVVVADLDARRFLVGAETTRVTPFGITYMVSNLLDKCLDGSLRGIN